MNLVCGQAHLLPFSGDGWVSVATVTRKMKQERKEKLNGGKERHPILHPVNNHCIIFVAVDDFGGWVI